jgi:hypothetical protein
MHRSTRLKISQGRPIGNDQVNRSAKSRDSFPNQGSVHRPESGPLARHVTNEAGSHAMAQSAAPVTLADRQRSAAYDHS